MGWWLSFYRWLRGKSRWTVANHGTVKVRMRTHCISCDAIVFIENDRLGSWLCSNCGTIGTVFKE